MSKAIIPIITGPTASGKSSFAIDLAKRIGNSVIISADSMQVYKHLNVGTAKASQKERAEVEHLMLDILELDEKFTVETFQKLALKNIDKVLAAGKFPIICGGTPQYITSLAEATKFKPRSNDSELRESLERRMEVEGSEALLADLKKVDPAKADGLHPNNKRRIIRALEIAYTTGEKQSDWDEQAESLDLDYEFKVYMFDWERDVLYERINKRVDIMLEEGILDEAKMLYEANLPADSTSLQAIGYKEFFPYFAGEMSLDEAITDLKKYSRRYAKRQLTWFRHKNWINYLDPMETNNIELVLSDIGISQ